MCDNGSNTGKKMSRSGSSVARGGPIARGRGRRNTVGRGVAGSSGTAVRRSAQSREEGTGDHPSPVMKVIVDPNEKSKAKELSQTTIRRDSSNKVSASRNTEGSNSRGHETDSMKENERRRRDTNSDVRPGAERNK